MKAAFFTSLVCAVMSIIAVLGSSAMTVVPAAESWQGYALLISTAFFLLWIGLAFWLRPRPNQATLPRWAQVLLVSTGVVYAIGILLPVVG